MEPQTSIFPEMEPRYCVDTNVILNFWNLNPENQEPYAKDVFVRPWQEFERCIEEGTIIAPTTVRDELKDMEIDELNNWIEAHASMFKDISSEDILAMRPIVNEYNIYGVIKNYAGDLQIMGFARARQLILITSERPHPGEMSKRNPKIPNVCDEFEVLWTDVVGFFRAESITI